MEKSNFYTFDDSQDVFVPSYVVWKFHENHKRRLNIQKSFFIHSSTTGPTLDVLVRFEESAIEFMYVICRVFCQVKVLTFRISWCKLMKYNKKKTQYTLEILLILFWENACTKKSLIEQWLVAILLNL